MTDWPKSKSQIMRLAVQDLMGSPAREIALFEENKRLREALEKIKKETVEDEIYDIARAALEKKEGKP